MNTPLSNLVIYNGYPLSIVAALVIHIMIFLTLLYLQSASDSQSLELVHPTVIKALFIDENPQLRNQKLMEERRVEQRRQEQQQQEVQAAKALPEEETLPKPAAPPHSLQPQSYCIWSKSVGGDGHRDRCGIVNESTRRRAGASMRRRVTCRRATGPRVYASTRQAVQ